MAQHFEIPDDVSREVALALVRQTLKKAGIASSALDARLLTTHVLGIDLATFLSHGDIMLNAAEKAAVKVAITRRLSGESVARIIGLREFWGLPFRLSADTLEPRPDTETLVEAVLATHPDRQAPLRFLDLGAGTGCILISLLTEYPNATGIGVDISPGALAAAAENARLNGVAEHAAFVQSDWFSALSGTFDIIVSNPPYIRSEVVPTLEREVRDHDPARALDGGPDGLDAYRHILAECHSFLAGNGSVFFEIGFDQQKDIERLAKTAGFNEIAFRNDLFGHARVAMLMRGRK